jgi:hypothetical protein
MTDEQEPLGKCSCPMWMGGLPAGSCGKPAYGDYIPGEEWRDAYTGERHRFDGKYKGYVPGLACPDHGGPLPGEPRVFQDGHSERGLPMYCAVWPDFEDLQVSDAAFDEKPWVAIKKLRAQKDPTP